jgi:4'-phosphopantetheinyl transferase
MPFDPLAPTRSHGPWTAAPDPLPLPKGEVHVWRLALEQPAARIEELHQLLDPGERARAERFLLERVRRQFIVGRGFLRLTLGRYLGCDPASLRFAYGNHGKPMLEGGDVHFNLTHSQERALLGVTRVGELGVDLERARSLQDLEGIARRFFAPREVDTLLALAVQERELAFFNCWTRKEAFIKAVGEGLARALDQFEVSLQPREPARLLWVAEDEAEPGRWALEHLEPWPGYVGCVALPARGWRLRCWHGM